jgi:hypothetical protein
VSPQLIDASQLTLCSTPVVHVYLDRFRPWCQRVLARRGTNLAADAAH